MNQGEHTFLIVLGVLTCLASWWYNITYFSYLFGTGSEKSVKVAGVSFISIIFIFILFFLIHLDEKYQKNKIIIEQLNSRIDSLSKRFDRNSSAIDTLNVKLGYVRTINHITIVDNPL